MARTIQGKVVVQKSPRTGLAKVVAKPIGRRGLGLRFTSHPRARNWKFGNTRSQLIYWSRRRLFCASLEPFLAIYVKKKDLKLLEFNQSLLKHSNGRRKRSLAIYFPIRWTKWFWLNERAKYRRLTQHHQNERLQG